MQLPMLPSFMLNDFPTRYSHQIIVLGLSFYLVSSGVILLFLLKAFYHFIRYPMFRSLAKFIFRLTLALFIMNFFMFLYFYALYTSNSSKGFVYTNEGFVLYYIFWILGSHVYINSVARIPQHRKKHFTIVNALLWLEVPIIIIFGILSIIISYSSITVLIAIITTLMVAFSMLYFYYTLKQEITNNTSKLVQARLAFFSYINALQLFWMIFAILPNVVLTALNYKERSQYALLIIPIISIISSVFLYWSFRLPDFFRKRYGIETKRFEKIIITQSKSK